MNKIDIQAIVEEVLKKVLKEKVKLPSNGIPVGVSGRHVHLSESDLAALFGPSYELTKLKDLSQPNQFAAEETVMVVGPRGAIEGVRILGPVRGKTQVEVSGTDAIKLGLRPPLRESGNILASAPATIVGPKGSVYLKEGLIIAQAHIHMTPSDAEHYGVRDGQFVKIKINSIRPITFDKVLIRVSKSYKLEMHIDTDEANAGLLQSGEVGELILSDSIENTSMVNIKEATKDSSSVVYEGKLLLESDVSEIRSTSIRIPKTTIITPLARDRARELGKTIISTDN